MEGYVSVNNIELKAQPITTIGKIYKCIPEIVLVIGIITIILFITKKQNKGIIYTVLAYIVVVVMYRLFTPMTGGLSTYEEAASKPFYLILSIILIIIQLIPLILALRKNKEDEVKKENV